MLPTIRWLIVYLPDYYLTINNLKVTDIECLFWRFADRVPEYIYLSI